MSVAQGCNISFNIVIDQDRDLTLVQADGVLTYDDFHDFLVSDKNGLTAKTVWDFSQASLSNLNQAVLQRIAVIGRDMNQKNGRPLAIALVASRAEDRLLLRLYDEISLHGARRARPHRLFKTLPAAIAWLDRATGQPGQIDGSDGPGPGPDPA